MRLTALSCLAVLVLVGTSACGAKRAEGDAGGRPVAFHVTLERAFVSTMERRVSTGVGVGTGISSSGASHMGVGLGVGFSSTQVYLLGGSGSGSASAFRKPLSWGTTDFTVPLTPGRQLTLTVQCEGGRQGWESLGTITIPEAEGAARVRVDLVASGPAVQATPSPAPAAHETGKDTP
jgi:hypothetical protein